jgi:dihydrodipicolinate synthase/N-acetylneuraminate lyase
LQLTRKQMPSNYCECTSSSKRPITSYQDTNTSKRIEYIKGMLKLGFKGLIFVPFMYMNWYLH